MISDLRYVDPATLTGGIQAREILREAGATEPIIDWALDTVHGYQDRCQALERELAAAHMDMNM